MDLINEQVSHKTLGIGTITGFDDKYIEVQFSTKTSKFIYPTAFESFLKLLNDEKQTEIIDLIAKEKQAEREKKQAEEQARRNAEAQRNAALQSVRSTGASARVKKSIDDMFAEDYHAKHLARQPILTYQQVEEQFGIRISGFGRGINPTQSTVVLISSIGKADGNFVYHDRWTEDGDYLYSGEGQTGDQAMTKGNLAIKNASSDGKAIHLFVKFSPQEYYYQGIFQLVDYTYEDDRDGNGDIRKEYKFRLRKVN